MTSKMKELDSVFMPSSTVKMSPEFIHREIRRILMCTCMDKISTKIKLLELMILFLEREESWVDQLSLLHNFYYDATFKFTEFMHEEIAGQSVEIKCLVCDLIDRFLNLTKLPFIE